MCGISAPMVDDLSTETCFPGKGTNNNIDNNSEVLNNPLIKELINKLINDKHSKLIKT